MEALADEEIVGLDDGVETGPITIHLPAVGIHEQLVLRRVKQKFRFQCFHELFPRHELAGGIKSPRAVSPIAIVAYCIATAS